MRLSERLRSIKTDSAAPAVLHQAE